MSSFVSQKVQKYQNDRSFKKIQKKALSGDIEAQYDLGMMYLRGDQIEASLEKATEWLGRSGRGGFEPAQMAVAELCENGQYFTPNYDYSYKWYELAALNDNPRALFKIGCFSVEGIGTNKAVKRGITHLESSARQHYPEASRYLAEMYYLGTDVPKSFDLMEEWFGKAYNDGLNNIGERIIELYDLESASGNIDATGRIAKIYDAGSFGIKQSPLTALKYYQTLADSGDSFGQFRYGSALLCGNVLRKNVQSGLKYLVNSAEQGNTDAQLMIGRYFLDSNDTENAIKYLKKASESGRLEANISLGDYYLENKNWDDALKWILAPAQKGDGQCAHLVAKCYFGKGDLKESADWYMKVLNQLEYSEKIALAEMLEKKLNDYPRTVGVLWTMVDTVPEIVDQLIRIYETKLDDKEGLANAYVTSNSPANLVKAGQIYENELYDYGKAIKTYKNAVILNSSLEGTLYEHIAEIYDYELDDPRSAAEYYEKSHPNTETCYRLVEIYLNNLNQQEKAADLLCKLGGEDNMIRAADLYYTSGRFVDAAGIFEDLGDKESLLRAADIYRVHGDPGKAAKLYEKTDDFEMAAECYAETCDFEKAAELYLHCAQRGFEFENEFNLKAAEMFEMEGDRYGSSNAYRNAANIYKRFGGEHDLDAAELYEKAQDYRDAADTYYEYSRYKWGGDIDTALKASELYEKSGNWYQAKNILENLADQNCIDAMKMLAEHYESEFEDKEALLWYRRAADAGDGDAENKVRQLAGSGSDEERY